MGGPKLVGPSSRKRTRLLLVEKNGQSDGLDDVSSYMGRHSIMRNVMTLSHRRSFFNASLPFARALRATARHLGLPTGI
jgi:hypothetical protein